MYSISLLANLKFIGTKTKFKMEQANINSQNAVSFLQNKAILSFFFNLFSKRAWLNLLTLKNNSS